MKKHSLQYLNDNVEQNIKQISQQATKNNTFLSDTVCSELKE